MQKIGSRVFCSATDLTHFAECQHLSWLDRLNLDEPMEKTIADEHARLIQAKGFSHEAEYLLHGMRAAFQRCRPDAG